jgi:dolichyl-phosphate-mannose--protein O-mannosyl transferase
MHNEAEKKEVKKVPFFARFLEQQDRVAETERMSPPPTDKYPSDFDEDSDFWEE